MRFVENISSLPRKVIFTVSCSEYVSAVLA